MKIEKEQQTLSKKELISEIEINVDSNQQNESRKKLFLVILSGLLIALSFPPLKLGFLAYIGLVPFFFLLDDIKSYKQAFKYGYIMGFSLSLFSLYWIMWVTVGGAIATVLYHPLHYGVVAILYVYLRKSFGDGVLYLFPFIWTAQEFARGFGELKFSWVMLAYSQSYYLPLIQYIDYTSALGVSFWIVWLNVIAYFAIRRYIENDIQWLKFDKKNPIILVTVFILLIIIPFLYGVIVLEESNYAHNKKLKVGVIQPNIDPYQKWEKAFKEYNFNVLERLTHSVALEKPDLVVWPETATPCWLRYEPEYLSRVVNVVNKYNIPILTGTLDYEWINENEAKIYNSAFLLKPGTTEIESYAKMHLVPFSERIAYREYFLPVAKLIDKLIPAIGNFAIGKERKVFKITVGDSSEVKFSTMICYESVFPDVVREFVKDGAEFILVITNDAWFGKTSGPFQHAQMSVFRAIENRVGIARSANTGVSSIIDKYGRIHYETDIWVENEFAGEVKMRNELTFYSKYGNIFSWVCLIISLIFFVISIIGIKYFRITK